eukprot:GHVU01143623.1.p2 GENE.GHVU01143623.1~~GHVU01143623.1.p2  ORF type:complete len:329 (-),score=52.53 GHVU01143623.1:1173-2159(-)
MGRHVVTVRDIDRLLTVNNVAAKSTLLNPKDKMNVPAAQRLMDVVTSADITLPDLGPSSDLSAFPLLQRICSTMTTPLSTTLDLSQQLVELSSLAHLFYYLFALKRIKFVSGPLYHDVQSYVKAAFVLTARGKLEVDDYSMYLMLLGSDLQEELHALLRTLLHSSNFSTLQLQSNITIVSQINDIFAKHPTWSSPDRRRDCQQGSDRVRPRHIVGNMRCADVQLFDCWAEGRAQAQRQLISCGFTEDSILAELAKLNHDGITLLSPDGIIVGVSNVGVSGEVVEAEDGEDPQERLEDDFLPIHDPQTNAVDDDQDELLADPVVTSEVS